MTGALKNVLDTIYREAIGFIDFRIPSDYVAGTGMTVHITAQDVVNDPGSPSFVQVWAATKLDTTSLLTIPLAGPFPSAGLWTIAPGQTVVLYCGTTTQPTFNIIGGSLQTGTVFVPGNNSNAFNWTKTVGANPYPISQVGGIVVVNGDDAGLNPLGSTHTPPFTNPEGAVQLDNAGTPASTLEWVTNKALKFGGVSISEGPTAGTYQYSSGDTITFVVERGPTTITAAPGNQTTILQIRVETSTGVFHTLDLSTMKVARPDPALAGLTQAVSAVGTPDVTSAYPWVLAPSPPPVLAVGDVIHLGCAQLTVTGVSGGGNYVVSWVGDFSEFLLPDDPNTAYRLVEAGEWSYNTPVSSITASQLTGKTAWALADGKVVGPLADTGGGVFALPFAASSVVLGLRYTSQIQTLYLTTQGVFAGSDQGKRKKLSGVTLRVDCTRGLLTGDSFDYLSPVPDFVGSGTDLLFTGDGRTLTYPNWDTKGEVCIQQTNPLPATVLGIIVEVTPGDTGH